MKQILKKTILIILMLSCVFTQVSCKNKNNKMQERIELTIISRNFTDTSRHIYLEPIESTKEKYAAKIYGEVLIDNEVFVIKKIYYVFNQFFGNIWTAEIVVANTIGEKRIEIFAKREILGDIINVQTKIDSKGFEHTCQEGDNYGDVILINCCNMTYGL